MDTINDNIVNELSCELQKNDIEMMSQLDKLAYELPEIYEAYVKSVKTCVESIIAESDLDKDTADACRVIGTIISKGFIAYGAAKYAIKHNKLLDKILKAKMTLAEANQDKIKYLLPKTQNLLASCKVLLAQILNSTYDLNNAQADNIRRMTNNIVLKVVNMYRIAYYHNELAIYLDREYAAWRKGNHTSGVEMPDIYGANMHILKDICIQPYPNAIKDTLLSSGTLLGREYILIGDPQISMLALQGQWTPIQVEKADSPIKCVMETNPTYEEYNRLTEKINRHNSFSPLWTIIGLTSVAITSIGVICYCFQAPKLWETITLAVIGIAAILAIAFRGFGTLKTVHLNAGEELLRNTNSYVEDYCGKIRIPKIDYNKKSAIKEMWKALTT